MTPHSYTLRNKRVWVAGHKGMVGCALCRRLVDEGCEILTVPRTALDLRSQAQTEKWMQENRPDAVIIAAATVGGIGANKNYPADFLYDNLMIAANIIHAAAMQGVEKLLFLGSSCIYPKEAPQPLEERSLLTGPLEPTNAPYAIAKIAGIKLCESYRRQYGHDFISAMPCNLYGPGDTYDPDNSHVIPALIMKMEKAKRESAENLELWGTGSPLREFLYVDDLADGLVHLLRNYSGEKHVNIGSGEEISIKDLALKIAAVTGFEGDIRFNPGYPDGTMRKVMDNSGIQALGWQPSTSLDEGLKRAYEDFLARRETRHAA